MNILKLIFVGPLALCAACSGLPKFLPGAGGTSAEAADFAENRETARKRMERLNWFVGDWRMERDNGFTVEHWEPQAGSSLIGMGYTVRDGELISYELMSIQSRDGDLFYVAHPGASVSGVEFKLTEISDGFVRFRNPRNEFPKWIRYERVGDNGCRAVVGGDSGEVVFNYLRFR